VAGSAEGLVVTSRAGDRRRSGPSVAIRSPRVPGWRSLGEALQRSLQGGRFGGGEGGEGLLLGKLHGLESLLEGLAASRRRLNYVRAPIARISAPADESLLFESVDQRDHRRAVHADAAREPLLGGRTFSIDERENGELSAIDAELRELPLGRLVHQGESMLEQERQPLHQHGWRGVVAHTPSLADPPSS
jgi:hypothetical protein